MARKNSQQARGVVADEAWEKANAPKTPQLSGLWLELLVFLVTAYFVYREGWSAAELVWSLWLTSIVLGLAIIVIWLAGQLSRANGSGLFTAAFFTVHYGLFHLVHAFFLIVIFTGDIGGDAIGAMPGPSFDGEIGPAAVFGFALSILDDYWLVLVATIIVRWRELRRAWVAEDLPDVLSYSTVVKMHIMIFALIGLSLIGWLPTFALIVVLMFHFFPLEALSDWWKKAR